MNYHESIDRCQDVLSLLAQACTTTGWGVVLLAGVENKYTNLVGREVLYIKNVKKLFVSSSQFPMGNTMFTTKANC